jgi:hypothetical protein
MGRRETTRTVIEREDGYHVAFVTGAKREEFQQLLVEHHYLHCHGNAGSAYAVLDPKGDVRGGVLIGATSSENADRWLIAPGHQVYALKRSWAFDDCPVPESQILRAALRDKANELGETILAVSYADPWARDERTGRGLLGHVYLAAGFFYAGETAAAGEILVDEAGRFRSKRQGAVTLTRGNVSTLRPGWRFVRVGRRRVWLAVVTPEGWSRTRRKREWRRCWAALNPERRVAAKRWVSEKGWSRLVSEGVRPIPQGLPIRRRGFERFQAAWWRGEQVDRGCAPVWVDALVQETLALLTEADVEGERTGGRVYAARAA